MLSLLSLQRMLLTLMLAGDLLKKDVIFLAIVQPLCNYTVPSHVLAEYWLPEGPQLHIEVHDSNCPLNSIHCDSSVGVLSHMYLHCTYLFGDLYTIFKIFYSERSLKRLCERNMKRIVSTYFCYLHAQNSPLSNAFDSIYYIPCLSRTKVIL